MKILRNFIIVCLLMIPLASTAVYLFKTLDASNKLNISQINCILKDSRGFVWFGTPAGLYRYDGYTFKNFQSNSQDGSSLPDSYISDIQEAFDGNLWVQTSAGMCIYSPLTESFERDMKQVYQRMGIPEIPNIIHIDSHKNLWVYIQNRGVYAYNMQQQLMYEFGYTDDVKGIPQGEIASIGECDDGALLVYRDGKIACCDIMHQQHTLWINEEIANRRLRVSSSLKAFADQNKNIWLYGQGTLMVLNSSTGTWDTEFGNRLGMTGVSTDRTVSSMASDKQGNVWIGTDAEGLIRMDVNTRDMEKVEPKSLNSKRLDSHTGILSIHVDDTDLLWVGTEKAGVAYYGKDIYKFQSALFGDITAMAEDSEGKVWYGTSSDGVIGYTAPMASLKVSAMAYTHDGSLWVGSRQNGLTRIKDGKTTIFSAAQNSNSSNTLIDDHVNALCTDKHERLWIATNGGLQMYNLKMGTFSTYTKENGQLTTNTITALNYGLKNNLLIGTSEGLIILNPSTREMTHVTGNKSNVKKFTNDYITQVMQDSRGLIWVGTREGINILDMEADSLYYITEKDGLCNNCICGLTEDKNKNIWITTTNGASRAVVQRDHLSGSFLFSMYNYDISDGLQSNEFNMNSIMTKSDGNVVLGGIYGVNWIIHHAKSEAEALPKVMLTQLFIGETEILTGHEYDGNIPLPQALNESNAIELNNDQNTFTIKFAAGNYNQCERLQFMYRMEGVNDDWRNGDPLTHGVTFRNLSSGKYTLHVKAISAAGAISKQERTLVIKIDRPWWLQWWMIVIYVILVAVTVYMWKKGIGKVSYLWSKKKAILVELARQREEVKSASDDLRQPMARMASIISNISEAAEKVETKEQVNTLHSQMLQIITRISEMQMYLENPEAKANTIAIDKLQLNEHGEVNLLAHTSDELTADFRPRRAKLETQEYRVMVVDDNNEFLAFIMDHLGDIFEMHTYNSAEMAIHDIDVLKPHIIVCKEDLPKISGSAICNRVKMNHSTQNIKFVLMTDGVLSSQEMTNRNITLAADDYLAKPFNMNEAAIRFSRLLGFAHIEGLSNVIEGEETRRLEGYNSSMTTSTIDYDRMAEEMDLNNDAEQDDGQTTADATANGDATFGNNVQTNNGNPANEWEIELYNEAKSPAYMGDYSMSSAMDRQLLRNIGQYVLQNMSRGQINLEEMAAAMGMGRVPFFHKVRNLTGKTPTELVRELRLKNACTLLVRTDINLTELATNVGFVTAENFISIFKDKFGMSPLEYRLKNRRKK